MNRILVDQVFCKGCRICVDQCPKGVLEVSEVRNAKGYLVPAAASPEKCTGCLLCEMICPDLAIFVEVEKNAARG